MLFALPTSLARGPTMGLRTKCDALGGASVSPGPAYKVIGEVEGTYIKARALTKRRPKGVSDFQGRMISPRNGRSSYPGPGEYIIPSDIDVGMEKKFGKTFGLRSEHGRFTSFSIDIFLYIYI